MPDISLIMPCYNRAYDLVKVLEAYDSQLGNPGFEIIAVDDGSSDRTYEILRSFQPAHFSLKVIHQQRNQGPAMARNVGITLASSPLILFVGDDILPDSYLVHGHLAAHRYYPNQETAILGKVVWPNDLPVNTLMAHIDGIGAQQFSYHYLRDGQEYDFRHFYTANISLKRDLLISQSKWFDTAFPFAAFEDVELSFRLAQTGMRIIYSSPLIGYHYHSHTIWSFSERQYRAGLMACLLVRIHPRSRNLIIGKKWPFQILKWYLESQLRSPELDEAARLEKDVLHLLSSYEWTPHPSLDLIYMRALGYFYYKGLITGTFTNSKRSKRIASIFAHNALKPLLKWCSKNLIAQQEEINL
jgi:glycosyltransferase involved in cell wall biosynthesis